MTLAKSPPTRMPHREGSPAKAAGLWGIGRFRAGTASLTYPVGKDDHARDVVSARAALASLGIGRGAKALVVSLLSEQALVWPFQAALRELGAVQSNAEASRFDAFRTAMFLGRLRYDAVFGVNGDVLDGLADLGRDPGEVFRGVRVVAAREDAIARLREKGIAATLWVHVGPAVAVGCGGDAVAHFDGEEWAITAREGELVISTRRPRAARVESQPTGIRGTVIHEPCACGRMGPRIVLEG